MKPLNESTVDLVIVGAGLAGLAAGAEAAKCGADVAVLEADEEPGGLTRSFEVDGYTFDCSGHLLHLAHAATRQLVESVTKPTDWLSLERDSKIWLRDRFVPYPFQMHLAYAPADVRDDCLNGLPEALPEFASTDPAEVRFSHWIEATLGPGIGRHFMVPYNEKLSTVLVDDLTCEWLGRFVPRPSLEEIREGAEVPRLVDTGYNKRFVYPARGGISLLWKGLASRSSSVRCGARVVSIDPRRRLVTTADGHRVRYREGVLSSAPLPAICGIVEGEGALVDRARALRANVVTCVNLGVRSIDRRWLGPQWVYLPERRYGAYRVGFYNRFSDSMAPPGREALYVEIAHGSELSQRSVVDQAVRDVCALSIIRQPEDIEIVHPVRIPDAYVIHDSQCRPTKTMIRSALAARGVHVIGRYGRWEYAAMEDALRQGIEAVQTALGLPAPTVDASAA